VDLFDVTKLTFRWWYVTVPLLVLTLVSAAVVSARVQPEFTAEGSLIVVGPANAAPVDTDEEPVVVNPLLSQSGALPTTAYIAALAASSPQVARILAEEGLSTAYDVAAQTRLPIILLEARAQSRDVATNTALRLVELIDDDLRLRQEAADVPPDQRVTVDVIDVSSAGGGDYGGRTRLRIVIVLFGLLATVAAAFALEAARRRRSERPVESDGEPSTDDSSTTGSDSDDRISGKDDDPEADYDAEYGTGDERSAPPEFAETSGR